MNQFISFLKYIFDIKDIIWFLLGIMIPVVYMKIRDKSRCRAIRRKLKKEEIKFQDNGIVSLGHGDPFYLIGNGRADILLDAPKEEFYINMPQDIEQEILKFNPKFFNTHWDKEQSFLDGQTEEEMLKEISNVLKRTYEETKKIFEDEKNNVAKLLLSKVQTGQPYFNGEMYGIKRMDAGRLDEKEIPTMRIQSYKCDYYTHRVMAAVYQRIYKENPSIVPNNQLDKYNTMRYFLTSMGMNVLLILEDENVIVFGKRLGSLINMDKDRWHVSMNEAVSITDLSEINETISLEKCIIRGINEELGYNAMNPIIYYGDIFFLKNPFETGISAFVKVSGLSYSQLEIAYSAAKDRELETAMLKKVKYDAASLKEFIEKNDLTDAVQYLIKMLLARHMKGAI